MDERMIAYRLKCSKDDPATGGGVGVGAKVTRPILEDRWAATRERWQRMSFFWRGNRCLE
jgi:hypothetical protein